MAYVLAEAPSLRVKFDDAKWLEILWAKAKSQADVETGLDIDTFPETCPWQVSDILSEGWLPG